MLHKDVLMTLFIKFLRQNIEIDVLKFWVSLAFFVD